LATNTPQDRGTGLSDIEARKRVVGSYANYADAERAVDFLSDRRFPVERTTIVGRNMHYVEQVTGRMGWLDALLRGALTGAIAGVLIGWLFFVFDWVSPLVARGWLIVDGLWFGTVVGAVMGLLLYALTRGRRDFSSIGAMRAERYDVLVDEQVADEAVRLLAEMSGGGARFERTEAPGTAPTSPPSDPVRP
jgi:hypothetical protein